VAMIANVHPGRTHFEDSNNTLEYAKRASVVRTTTTRRLSRVAAMSQAQDTRSTSSSSSGATACALATSVDKQLLQDVVRGRRWPEQADSVAHTTASSPEECLSEISLSIGAPESDTSPVPSGAEGSHDAEPFFGNNSAEERGGTPEPGRVTPDGTNVLIDGGVMADVSLTEAHSAASASSPSCEMSELASRIVATLRSEKAQLATRLADVMQERDSLVEDRRELEKANERLRAVNAEKDEQLASLLARCCGGA